MGEYTDERCDWYWGNVQCLDDLNHIEDENGGHHAFDLSHLRNPVNRPVLVNHNDRVLKQRAKESV